MRSVVFVAGARPNFVKIAPIMRALAGHPALHAELVHTGQHYDFEMSDVFFEQLGIPTPDVRLEVGSGRHAEQTGRIMTAFDSYLVGRSEPPLGIVVVGDVNSTMACALVAAKLGIPVAHVEAGLRSFDRTMPEEINRLVTDAVAELLLVSDPAGMTNLAREGIPSVRVAYCGNVMIDSLVAQLEAARALAMPRTFGLDGQRYAVVTLHRPSNVDLDERLRALVHLITRIANRVPVVFPVHPRTARRLVDSGLRAELGNDPRIVLTPSLGYREFLGLVDQSAVVVSDSGGVQEETSYLGIPCVTLRSNTERPVTVTAGTNVLVGDDLDAAWDAIVKALAVAERRPSNIDGWDGKAAGRVVDCLVKAWT